MPYPTIVITCQMMSSLRIVLHFPVVHRLRTMRKPNPERDHLASLAGLLAIRAAECEERPAKIGPVQDWPRNIYLPGSGVCPPNFHLSDTRSGNLPHCMQYFTPLSGDSTTCCLPPWASIFWIMSLLADFSFHRLLCTTAPLIHMIICCTSTRQ